MSEHHGLNDPKGIKSFGRSEHGQQENRFGRMFPHLRPLYTNPDELTRLGAPKGPMDMTGGEKPKRTKSVAVGDVIFGQFIDHDITLDVTSSLTSVNDASETLNVRTPTLDLDCIYGDGPEASAHLYFHGERPFAGVKLLTGADADKCLLDEYEFLKDDLSRSSHGAAIIGDHRNDENRLISQMQLAVIRFHNKVVESIHSDLPPGADLFEEARKLVTWHYQWVVVNDFLKKMCGGPVVASILGGGRRYYKPVDQPFIPVEFSVAAYRFGHSMVPQSVQVQKNKKSFPLFGKVFGKGFSRLTNEDAIVDWRELVVTDGSRKVQMAERLDAKMAGLLLNLPFVKHGPTSLATRNLLRGANFLLPSGERVAEELGRPSEEIERVSQVAKTASGDDIDLSGGTPLWYYILCEAETVGRETEPEDFERGEGLGPTGARLVAEVIIGLIELDERSYLGKDRSWSPESRIVKGQSIDTLGAMLTF